MPPPPFVAAQGKIQLAMRIVQRIENWEIALSRHAEAPVCAKCQQALHQELSSIPKCHIRYLE
jgi:hypothetical protein